MKRMKIAVLLSLLLLPALLLSCGTESEATTEKAQITEAGSVTEAKVTEGAAVTTGAIVTEDPYNNPEAVADPVFDSVTGEISTYTNPVSKMKSAAWSASSDCGDPFCMRWNGKYYLYPSRHTGAECVQCWTSVDLVNWTFEGNVAEGITIDDAYAPEVTYFNGKFYMVTSPSGNGHYVLESDSPLGPFTVVSENQGHSIDGSIFIDNDGKWYFMNANSGGILIGEMSSPTTLPTDSSVAMPGINNGWTEGPGIFYRDGLYYLTCTGNHVLNKAYRVVYGVATRSVKRFSLASNNPLIVSTTKTVSGIGHSSTVKGPDLDSYYLVYHSRSSTRPLNVDRLTFNGTTMNVEGPTVESAQICPMPDIYSFFDSAADLSVFGGKGSIKNRDYVLTGTAVAVKELGNEKYTIEITTTGVKSEAGVIFGYTDENNYGAALFDAETEELIVRFVKDGKATETRTALVRSFDMAYNFNAVQAIQVEKSGNTFTFYVNDRLLTTAEAELTGTKVGLYAKDEASFGYFGAVDEVGGSSDDEVYKPVGSQTGSFEAISCTEENIETESDKNGYKSVVAIPGNSYNYRILAGVEGSYSFTACFTENTGAVLDVYVDGVYAKTLTANASTKDSSETIRGITLSKGQHIVTVHVKKGRAVISEYRMLYTTEVKDISLTFNSSSDGRAYKDGTGWTFNKEEGYLEASGTCKRLYGDYKWGDYTVECDFSTTSVSTFGILVRTSNPSDTNYADTESPDTAEDAAKSGINWMQGYYVSFTGTNVYLNKINFATATKASTALRLTKGETYHVKVVCKGSVISVYVNDECVIEYNDPDPFVNGMAGIRMDKGTVKFDNFKVTALTD